MNTVKKALMERWTTKAPAVLSIANIQDKYIRENMAKLMENQRFQDIGNALNEDFGMGVGAPLGADQGIPHSGDSKAVFAPISLALVRRVFPQLFANVLVGVQPLSGPVGLAFALRYVYKDAGDPNKLVEAAWKAVPEYSGFSGSTANTSGAPDAGTAVDTQSAESWKITGDYDEIQTHNDFSTGIRGKIPELGLMFSRQSIVAKTRKLAASFSLESAEDIKRMRILDVMMPKKDGFTLAQEIRQASSDVPIIFLTAKLLKEDILEGFKIGADDYITKPFSMEELVFRVEAILRRVRGKKSKESTIYKVGNFIFDTQKQLLVIGEKQTKLTTKENELLALLCSHANEILQRDFALKTIWIDDNYFNARSMDVYITKLRKHLKDDPQIEIINIHGKGYKLIIPEEE